MTDMHPSGLTMHRWLWPFKTDEERAIVALLEANGMRCGEESLSRLILETNAAAIRARTP